MELDLSDNAFGPTGIEGVKNLLVSPVCFTLKVLKFNNNGLGIGGGRVSGGWCSIVNVMVVCPDVVQGYA